MSSIAMKNRKNCIISHPEVFRVAEWSALHLWTTLCPNCSASALLTEPRLGPPAMPQLQSLCLDASLFCPLRRRMLKPKGNFRFKASVMKGTSQVIWSVQCFYGWGYWIAAAWNGLPRSFSELKAEPRLHPVCPDVQSTALSPTLSGLVVTCVFPFTVGRRESDGGQHSNTQALVASTQPARVGHPLREVPLS